MNTFLAFALFLPLLFFQSSDANTDLIVKTCKIIPYYDLCVSTLEADPSSSKADVYGLALIIVEAVKSKSIMILDLIKKLKESNPQWPLSECRDTYHAIVIGDIPEAEQALQFGNPKFAETGMTDAGNGAGRCIEEFAGLKSQLPELNMAVYYLTHIAVPIIRTLL